MVSSQQIEAEIRRRGLEKFIVTDIKKFRRGRAFARSSIKARARLRARIAEAQRLQRQLAEARQREAAAKRLREAKAEAKTIREIEAPRTVGLALASQERQRTGKTIPTRSFLFKGQRVNVFGVPGAETRRRGVREAGLLQAQQFESKRIPKAEKEKLQRGITVAFAAESEKIPLTRTEQAGFQTKRLSVFQPIVSLRPQGLRQTAEVESELNPLLVAPGKGKKFQLGSRETTAKTEPLSPGFVKPAGFDVKKSKLLKKTSRQAINKGILKEAGKEFGLGAATGVGVKGLVVIGKRVLGRQIARTKAIGAFGTAAPIVGAAASGSVIGGTIGFTAGQIKAAPSGLKLVTAARIIPKRAAGLAGFALGFRGTDALVGNTPTFVKGTAPIKAGAKTFTPATQKITFKAPATARRIGTTTKTGAIKIKTRVKARITNIKATREGAFSKGRIGKPFQRADKEVFVSTKQITKLVTGKESTPTTLLKKGKVIQFEETIPTRSGKGFVETVPKSLRQKLTITDKTGRVVGFKRTIQPQDLGLTKPSELQRQLIPKRLKPSQDPINVFNRQIRESIQVVDPLKKAAVARGQKRFTGIGARRTESGKPVLDIITQGQPALTAKKAAAKGTQAELTRLGLRFTKGAGQVPRSPKKPPVPKRILKIRIPTIFGKKGSQRLITDSRLRGLGGRGSGRLAGDKGGFIIKIPVDGKVRVPRPRIASRVPGRFKPPVVGLPFKVGGRTGIGLIGDSKASQALKPSLDQPSVIIPRLTPKQDISFELVPESPTTPVIPKTDTPSRPSFRTPGIVPAVIPGFTPPPTPKTPTFPPFPKIVTPTGLPGFFGGAGGRSPRFGAKQKKGLTPTLFAGVFGVTGKTTRAGIVSGFGLRASPKKRVKQRKKR